MLILTFPLCVQCTLVCILPQHPAVPITSPKTSINCASKVIESLRAGFILLIDRVSETSPWTSTSAQALPPWCRYQGSPPRSSSSRFFHLRVAIRISLREVLPRGSSASAPASGFPFEKFLPRGSSTSTPASRFPFAVPAHLDQQVPRDS